MPLILTEGGVVQFTFLATAGLQYRVQYENDLTDRQWQTLGSDITANSNSVSVSDVPAPAQRRFYRVVQLN